ncbi:hypothetical protein [Cryobacterium sp. TMS1-13-1]|uniref:hypothetical protein n=1 Tax=Cryobacterium sp. TMS1-13-1 TaxID=1259220 RepID=UPI00106D68A6|nr:hypothetical protein [Cryobacterium sp. TMS1-13-1]TFD21721.1 hypothetical protein E3T31_13270 [Cryobacterium sp. TMS1-13-1]
MEPTRFLLKGPTMREVQERVLLVHGRHAVIIAAERVTVGGIRGFFARQHYEVTVEVPAPESQRRSAHSGLDLNKRLGIAALLDDADDAEYEIARTAPQLSTASDGFAALMDELTFATTLPSGLPAGAGYEGGGAPSTPGPSRVSTLAVPAPLTRPGDLVLILGLGEDPVTIARLMQRLAGGGDVFTSGTVVGPDRVDDRRSARAARARGVEKGCSAFIAFGIDPASDAEARAADLEAIGADQIWVVVDAGRKSEDSTRWVNMVNEVVPIDAVAAIGRHFTTSPTSVESFGLPVEWMDGRVAAPPSGRRAARPGQA